MKIYAAGKIRKNDWRGVREHGRLDETRDKEESIGNGFFYVGPWFFGCDHGCTHVENSHAAVFDRDGGDLMADTWQNAQRAVFANSVYQIRKSDVVYARLDSVDAYGTFFEIGYAVGIGKPVFIEIVGPGGRALSDDAWFIIRGAIASVKRFIGDIRTSFDFSLIPFWRNHPGSFAEYIRDLEAMIPDPVLFPEHDCDDDPDCEQCANHVPITRKRYHDKETSTP